MTQHKRAPLVERKSVAQMTRDELEVAVAAQNQWIDHALAVFAKVREMTNAADRLMASRGQTPSKFSNALTDAISALESQVERRK